jgi:FKBP-type peptidyl-prolyl cis-trans isomerase FkpA
LKNSWILGCFLVAVSTVATVNAQEKGFKIDKISGVEYRFIKHDKNGTKPADTDFARIVMLWTGKNVKGDADSVFLNSHEKAGDSIGALTLPLKKAFRGCLEAGILMMAKGDSAVFRINADSLFIKSFHAPPARIPHFITGTTMFIFHIKMVGFETKAEMMAEREAAKKKHIEDMQKKAEAAKAQEPVDIATFLQKNYPTAKPDADSIFYLETAKGAGAPVQEGDSLTIKYKGTFLDGKIFDQSDRGTGPGTFKILYTKNVPLIRGWISVLATMNEGEKVKVLIPSKMGYGVRGGGAIQPYTPLIFDMELITVKANK